MLFSFMYLEFNAIIDPEREATKGKERQQCAVYLAEGNGAVYETKFLNTRS